MLRAVCARILMRYDSAHTRRRSSRTVLPLPLSVSPAQRPVMLMLSGHPRGSRGSIGRGRLGLDSPATRIMCLDPLLCVDTLVEPGLERTCVFDSQHRSNQPKWLREPSCRRYTKSASRAPNAGPVDAARGFGHNGSDVDPHASRTDPWSECWKVSLEGKRTGIGSGRSHPE